MAGLNAWLRHGLAPLEPNLSTLELFGVKDIWQRSEQLLSRMQDAETLAAHLLRHASAARDRHASLEAAIADEDTARAAVEEESDALRAEIDQYRGWLSGEREGGSAYRMSKAIQDERERRAMLEGELGSLRERLSSASVSLARLQHLGRETPEAQQARAAESALAQLARLHQLSLASAAPPPEELSP